MAGSSDSTRLAASRHGSSRMVGRGRGARRAGPRRGRARDVGPGLHQAGRSLGRVCRPQLRRHGLHRPRAFGHGGSNEMTPEMKGFLLLSVLKLLVVFTVVMVGVALLTLMERKVSAWMQNRLGPNRVGYGGLLQPAADGLKNILKEETFPAEANPVLFTIAPALAFIPALML